MVRGTSKSLYGVKKSEFEQKGRRLLENGEEGKMEERSRIWSNLQTQMNRECHGTKKRHRESC